MPARWAGATRGEARGAGGGCSAGRGGPLRARVPRACARARGRLPPRGHGAITHGGRPSPAPLDQETGCGAMGAREAHPRLSPCSSSWILLEGDYLPKASQRQNPRLASQACGDNEFSSSAPLGGRRTGDVTMPDPCEENMCTERATRVAGLVLALIRSTNRPIVCTALCLLMRHVSFMRNHG